MVLNNGLGRPRRVKEFKTVHEYLEGYIFPVKDGLIAMKQDEIKKERIYKAAYGRRLLQEQKLEKAYANLEHFRK